MFKTKKFKYIIICTIICLNSKIGFTQTNNMVVPEGIKYKFSDEGLNQAAITSLKEEISKPTYSLFDNMLYCGPNLWDKYKNIPKISKIEKGNIDFQVPQSNGKIIKKNGKLIQSNEDFKILWDQITEEIKSSNYTIRKLNTKELNYYWSIIFFDIDEPIFVVENDTITIIVDLNNDIKLLFLEIY